MNGLAPFAPQIDAFWEERFRQAQRFDPTMRVVVANDQDCDTRVMILEHPDGECRVVINRAIAALIDDFRSFRTIRDLRAALAARGINLHGADRVFYYPQAEATLVAACPAPDGVRQLGAVDAALFAAFQAEATPEDLDAAYVELDHWAVFGAFSEDRLVAAGSMYPWMEAPLADMGVLTLEAERGLGFGRSLVRAMATYAVRQGLQPQFRCQLDNIASAALAKSAGFSLYGDWTVEAQG